MQQSIFAQNFYIWTRNPTSPFVDWYGFCGELIESQKPQWSILFAHPTVYLSYDYQTPIPQEVVIIEARDYVLRMFDR